MHDRIHVKFQAEQDEQGNSIFLGRSHREKSKALSAKPSCLAERTLIKLYLANNYHYLGSFCLFPKRLSFLRWSRSPFLFSSLALPAKSGGEPFIGY